jgi:proteasome lid subunit RPN8/RPN11
VLKATRRRVAPSAELQKSLALPPTPVEPIRRLVLTDEVSRTLFGEYAYHRTTKRGREEIGWDLMGIRQGDAAIVWGTLPAGEARDSSAGHVLFDRDAQGIAARILRQASRQLKILGVVHTHPGTLRHPSSDDYRGDIEWVANLRGGEGVFGIGTADAEPKSETGISWQPASNVQCLGDLCLSWYVLGKGDRNYRPLSVELSIGRDLAAPLRPIWGELEDHGERLERLARQLSGVKFDIEAGYQKPALIVNVPLTDEERSIRVELEGKAVRYRLRTPEGTLASDLKEDRIDVGVFLMLSELAAR